MKYLGIDYGKKKVGVAVSDDGGTVAFPRTIIANDSRLFDKLKEIVIEENVGTVVLGESLDFSGEENPIMKDVKSLSSLIEKELRIKVVYFPEYMSSMEARRIKNDREDDSRAAAIVLQSYLDKINKH